ncbi:ras-related protein Rab-9B isoform X2 [Macaca mulatta]
MGLVRASELHLTPRRLPRLSASAPARQLSSLASSSFGARGCAGRQHPRPGDWPRRASCHALLSQLAETESNRDCPEFRTGGWAQPWLPWEPRCLDSATCHWAVVRNILWAGQPRVVYRPRRPQRSCSPAELRGPEGETELSTREHKLPNNGAQRNERKIAEADWGCSTSFQLGGETVFQHSLNVWCFQRL